MQGLEQDRKRPLAEVPADAPLSLGSVLVKTETGESGKDLACSLPGLIFYRKGDQRVREHPNTDSSLKVKVWGIGWGE